MLLLYSLILLKVWAQPLGTQTPTLLIRVLQPETLSGLEVHIKRGQQAEKLYCGDGQEYVWDGIQDGITTCAYYRNINIVEHIIISSSTLNEPILDAVISPISHSVPEVAFSITQNGLKWSAHQIALHHTNSVTGIQSMPWKWLIALWSILIANLLGWIWWKSK